MKKCEIESLEVKSYRVVFSDLLTSKPIALELVIVDKKQRLYQIIPEKECLMDLNALHFRCPALRCRRRCSKDTSRHPPRSG